MTEYNPTDRFHEPDTDRVWEVEKVIVDYRLAIYDPSAEDPESRVETVTVPQESLSSKLDYNDLEPIEADSGDEEESSGEECPECGETFDTEHGLATHKGRAHSNDDDDDVAE